ncbi:MAG: CE1 family esterase [Acidimicrobiales bacterium]
MVSVVGAACSSPTSHGAASIGGTLHAVAIGAPIPSPGCRRPQAGPVTNERVDLEVGGVARWFLITTPSPTTPSTTGSQTNHRAAVPRPLVLDFHGLAEGASLQALTSQFGVLGQKDGFVAVFPQGTGNPVQWNTVARGTANPDLTYVADVLDHVESSQCIDTSRVYADGFSDGAFMVSLLACTMSGHFAAIAAVSGLQLPNPCRTRRHVPIVAFHGTADPILFFNGGVGTATLNRLLGKGGSTDTPTTLPPVRLHGAGYPATVQAWATKDGCDPKSTDTTIASHVVRRTYSCPPAAAVDFYIILGGGHAWPGSSFSRSISSLTGFTTFQINATDLIWRFFEQFRL